MDNSENIQEIIIPNLESLTPSKAPVFLKKKLSEEEKTNNLLIELGIFQGKINFEDPKDIEARINRFSKLQYHERFALSTFIAACADIDVIKKFLVQLENIIPKNDIPKEEKQIHVYNIVSGLSNVISKSPDKEIDIKDIKSWLIIIEGFKKYVNLDGSRCIYLIDQLAESTDIEDLLLCLKYAIENVDQTKFLICKYIRNCKNSVADLHKLGQKLSEIFLKLPSCESNHSYKMFIIQQIQNYCSLSDKIALITSFQEQDENIRSFILMNILINQDGLKEEDIILLAKYFQKNKEILDQIIKVAKSKINEYPEILLKLIPIIEIEVKESCKELVDFIIQNFKGIEYIEKIYMSFKYHHRDILLSKVLEKGSNDQITEMIIILLVDSNHGYTQYKNHRENILKLVDKLLAKDQLLKKEEIDTHLSNKVLLNKIFLNLLYSKNKSKDLIQCIIKLLNKLNFGGEIKVRYANQLISETPTEFNNDLNLIKSITFKDKEAQDQFYEDCLTMNEFNDISKSVIFKYFIENKNEDKIRKILHCFYTNKWKDLNIEDLLIDKLFISLFQNIDFENPYNSITIKSIRAKFRPFELNALKKVIEKENIDEKIKIDNFSNLITETISMQDNFILQKHEISLFEVFKNLEVIDSEELVKIYLDLNEELQEIITDKILNSNVNVSIDFLEELTKIKNDRDRKSVFYFLKTSFNSENSENFENIFKTFSSGKLVDIYLYLDEDLQKIMANKIINLDVTVSSSFTERLVMFQNGIYKQNVIDFCKVLFSSKNFDTINNSLPEDLKKIFLN